MYIYLQFPASAWWYTFFYWWMYPYFPPSAWWSLVCSSHVLLVWGMGLYGISNPHFPVSARCALAGFDFVCFPVVSEKMTLKKHIHNVMKRSHQSHIPTTREAYIVLTSPCQSIIYNCEREKKQVICPKGFGVWNKKPMVVYTTSLHFNFLGNSIITTCPKMQCLVLMRRA